MAFQLKKKTFDYTHYSIINHVVLVCPYYSSSTYSILIGLFLKFHGDPNYGNYEKNRRENSWIDREKQREISPH